MTKLIYGKYLVRNADDVVPSGAVIFRDGKIIQIGKYEDLIEQFQVDEIIGSPDYLVAPGFINAHGHGKGLTDFQLGSLDDTLETWRYMRGADPEFNHYYDVLWKAIRLLASGVTTTMHNHLLNRPENYDQEFSNTLNAYLDSGIRVAFAPSIANQNLFVYGDNTKFIQSLPTSLQKMVKTHIQRSSYFGEAEYFKSIERLRKDFESDQVKIMHGPLSPQWCEDGLLMRIKKSSDKLGMQIHIHVLQTLLQKIYGLKSYKKSLIEHLYDLGFLDRNVTCGHSVWLSEKDIDLLSEKGASVTHHASCNLRIRNGIAPIFSLLEKGIKVGLGMDEKGLSDDDDFIEEMRVVSKLHRMNSYHLDSEHLHPKDSFKMGTIYGAEILGFSEKVGTIEEGKAADIILIDLKRIKEPFLHPGHSIIDALIYRGKGSDVDTVIVGGETLMKGREFTKVDKKAVIVKLRESIRYSPGEAEKKKLLINDLKKHIARYYEKWYGKIDQMRISPFYLMNNKL